MSEKRFTLVGGKNKFNEILVKVYDNFEEEVIEKQKVVDLLNEQQATIEAKNEYQRTLEAKIRRLKDRIKILEKAEGWQN